MPFALNSLLPKDIRVLDCVEVGQSFMAIESIIAKEYTYVIYSAPHMLPLWQNRVYHYPEHLDLAVMQRAAADFEGTHDFACVQSTGTVVKSTIRTMLEFEVRQEGNLFVFRMKATGFLYNMARSLAGTLLYMSREKICAVAPLIATRNRNLAGPTLPPQGLYMTGVWYAEEPFGPCSGCTSMPWEIGL
jgi:tRNA pseudouridine38-40 synthase